MVIKGVDMLIGDKYKIESDSLNVTLYKPVKVKKSDSIRWQPIAYFSSFENALKHLVDLEVMETGLSAAKHHGNVFSYFNTSTKTKGRWHYERRRPVHRQT